MKAMKNKIIFQLFLLLCLCISFSIRGSSQTQTDSLRWKIQTKDGNRFVGKIMEEGDSILILQTENLGEITIQKTNIRSKRSVNGHSPSDGLNWYENNTPHQYVLLPTGIFRGEKGTGSYYENRYVLINHFHLQMTEGFSVGIGLIPAFIFEGAGTPIWLNTRFRIKTKNKNLHISANLFHGQVIFDPYSDNVNGSFAFGMATYGNDDISFTLGTGYGIYDQEWIKTPAIAIGGTVRAGKRLALYLESLTWNIGVADNYYDDVTSLTMMGGRALWNRFSLDFGLMLGYNDSESYSDYRIPYLGIVIPFDR